MYKIKMGFKDDCACLQSKMFSQSVKCGTWGTLKNTPKKMRQVCVAFTKSGNVYKKSSFTLHILDTAIHWRFFFHIHRHTHVEYIVRCKLHNKIVFFISLIMWLCKLPERRDSVQLILILRSTCQ